MSSQLLHGQLLHIDKLLDSQVSENASDMHLNIGARPMLRRKGRLVPIDTKVLEPEDTRSLFKGLTSNDVHEVTLNSRGSVDFALDYKGGVRFRVNACIERNGTKLTVRRLPNTLLSMQQIGLPKQMAALASRSRGLILVTGPTGSGKTTTLASLVAEISRTQNKHILMIEEPTEYVFGHGNGIVTQREVPTTVPTFHQGVMDALRENPDVIVVGEMRDNETIRAALTAAETGHLVMGTLHTSSAAGTVNRIIDVFPGIEQATVRAQLSVALIGVLCQQLIPRADGSGQVAAFEFMVVNPAVSNLIRAMQTERINSTISTSRKEGMRLLDDHLFELVSSGVITREAALQRANDANQLLPRFKALEE